jgi:hypothetical protein
VEEDMRELGDARDVLEQFTHLAGWDDDSVIQLLCEFILQKNLVKDLNSFLAVKVEEEHKMGEENV